MSDFYAKLTQIQESQCFDLLEPLKNPELWDQMLPEEKELFARLLLLQGAEQLARGEPRVFDTFELAARVTSYSPWIFFQQGLIFASQENNSRCLKLAINNFKKAAEGKPSSFAGWHKWAESLLILGILDHDLETLVDAQTKFVQANTLFPSDATIELTGVFHWKWAVCLAMIGLHSGEPVDFFESVNHFRIAAQSGCQNPQFLLDYGNALADLGSLIEKQELFLEALQHFELVTKMDPENSEGWRCHGCCLAKLHEMAPKAEYVSQAFESFKASTALYDQNGYLWLKWAQLESHQGRATGSKDLLESSLEKFSKANQLEPNHPGILGNWAETELILAFYHDRHDLILSAKSKIIKSLELQPGNSDGWYVYGACLNEMGRYFEEKSYYLEAIEKFQHGLSLKRQNPLLWYGMALSNFALGELQDDQSLIEKSVYYCARVLECGGSPNAQFWNDWGVALLKLGEMTNQSKHVELAIEKFERALKQPLFDPENEDVDLEWIYNYSCALDLLGELTEDPRHFEKAVHMLSQLLQMEPTYTEARYNLALALSHLAHALSDLELFNKAVEHFQFLVNEDPEDDIVLLDFATCLVNLALLVDDVNKPNQSEALFRQAEGHLLRTAALGNNDAYYLLASVCSLSGQYPLGMHFLEKAEALRALPTVEQILHDDWLEDLRNTPSFKQFLNRLTTKQPHEEK